MRISMRENPRIIISLTSYPKRIHNVDKAIKTLLIQTHRPDKIILWLSREEFPNQNEDLPDSLVALCRYGLAIHWVDGNLKSHKKYYYAMKEYYDDIIITVDDDMYYPPQLVEELYHSYVNHPHAVSCTWANLITKDKNEELSPYGLWKKNYACSQDSIEAMDLLAVGCGGILYPPKCFNLDILCDEISIESCCPFQDDLWMKVNEIRENISTVLIKLETDVVAVKESQSSALSKGINEEGNDKALKKLDEYLKKNNNITLSKAIFSNCRTIEKRNKEITKKIMHGCSAQDVYIYGAGKIAKAVYECLKIIGLEESVKGFIVTEADGDVHTLCDRPVMEVEQIKQKNCLILISTSGKFHKEILHNLNEHNFYKVAAISSKFVKEYNECQKKQGEVMMEFLNNVF